MEELNQVCACGGSSKFLRKKGSATGLYCGECEKWVKWVGKKDIDKYLSRGFKPHPEGYVPPVRNAEQSNNSASQQSNYGHVTDVGNDTHRIIGNHPEPPFMDEDELPDFGDDLEPEEESYNRNPLNRSSKRNDDTICLTCVSGVIEPLTKSNQVSAHITDGVMNIKNVDGTRLYGHFEIKYCPSCGEYVGN